MKKSTHGPVGRGMHAVAAALLSLAVAAGTAVGQENQDSVRVHQLNTLVVTAERDGVMAGRSTAAISILSQRELRQRPVRTLAEALQQVPGITFVDFEGTGADPQIMVRGFYGGGETESVVLLRDGRPLNVLENGRIEWDRVPLFDVASIEVLRGGASAVWGDAALGGVIHVRSSTALRSGLRGSVTAGEPGSLRAALGVSDAVGGRPFAISGNYNRLDGFREHSERSTGGVSTAWTIRQTPTSSLSLVTDHDWRSMDVPGPVPESELENSRTAISPFFRFDHTDERWHRFTIEQRRAESALRGLNAYLAADYRESDRIRTIPLAPFFADTRLRELVTARLLGSAQYELPGPTGRDTWLFGVDGSIGRAKSLYFEYLQGDPDVYRSATPSRGDLDQRGTSRRAALAGFFHWAWQPTDAVRVTVGGRLDWLLDSFEASAPSEPVDRTTDHLAFSPKAGINLRLVESASHQARLYANVTRSFKAPTLDQLFDQRFIPIPEPPYEISFANADLKPQYGTSVEAGIYQSFDIGEDVSAEMSLAAYHMSMKDELDFDLQTLRYMNIGKSRHRGIESGVRVQGPFALGAFANYTLQAAVAQSGDYEGNYLKAIPRHFISAGVDAGRSSGPRASLIFNSAQGIYLDDANTKELDGWTRWDARLSWRKGSFQLFADIFNLFDAEYSTTAFPDAAVPDVIYHHPAAGRLVQVGIRRDW